MSDRCEWSDLATDECAHCRGDDPSVKPGETPPEPLPHAVPVWPVRDPKRSRPAPVTWSAGPEADDTARAAANLRSIRQMAALLGERALDLGDDQAMPGGEAMVNLAYGANLEAWENHEQATERYVGHPDQLLRRVYTSVEDEDPEEAWSPFQLLSYWSEGWRRELGMDYDMRATITSEANFLANPDVLDWARSHELGWEDFLDDVTAARTGIENIVRDGIRVTRSRIVCDKPHGDRTHKRLVVVYGKDGEPSGYKAPCCHATYTSDEAKRAHAKQMRSTGAERYVTTTEAVDALAVQGWQRRTVRRWIEPLRPVDDCTECGRSWPAQEYPACPNKVYADGDLEECGGLLLTRWRGSREVVPESWCDLRTRRTYVWWPALWRRHLVERHEREGA